ncbi:MAG: hypothetical protein RJA26_386 [Actinomycetota bacterium]|jgi:YggT family protein
MPIVVAILQWALEILLWSFIARFVLDLVLSVNPQFRPRGLFLVLAEIVMTVTDVPLKFLRRFIKPLRLGPVALDFSWTIAILLVSILQGLVARLG